MMAYTALLKTTEILTIYTRDSKSYRKNKVSLKLIFKVATRSNNCQNMCPKHRRKNTSKIVSIMYGGKDKILEREKKVSNKK